MSPIKIESTLLTSEGFSFSYKAQMLILVFIPTQCVCWWEGKKAFSLHLEEIC